MTPHHGQRARVDGILYTQVGENLWVDAYAMGVPSHYVKESDILTREESEDEWQNDLQDNWNNLPSIGADIIPPYVPFLMKSSDYFGGLTLFWDGLSETVVSDENAEVRILDYLDVPDHVEAFDIWNNARPLKDDTLPAYTPFVHHEVAEETIHFSYGGNPEDMHIPADQRSFYRTVTVPTKERP